MKWYQWWYFRTYAKYIWEIPYNLDDIADQLYAQYHGWGLRQQIDKEQDNDKA